VTENIVTTVVPSVRAGGHIYNDSDRQIVVSPTDGFVRFVYFDQSSWDKLYLVRCLDNNCTTSATTTLVTDSMNLSTRLLPLALITYHISLI
jgi:hypothetical protein